MNALTEVQVLDVITDQDVPLRVVRIPGGMHNPVERARDNDADMVEFYDRRHAAIWPKVGGQFIGGYFKATLLDDLDPQTPLALDRWVATWTVDPDTVALVRAWLRHLDRAPAEPLFFVVNNVTGKRVSKGYATVEAANAICRAYNVPSVGGQYGVENRKGERV